MNKNIGAAILALLVAGAGAWYFWPSSRPADVAPPAAVSAPIAAPPPAAAPPAATPAIRYPLAPAAGQTDLAQGEAGLRDALVRLFGKRLLALIFGDELIYRVVATVDSLPRADLATDAMLFKPVPGAFATAGKGDALVIGRRNAARYEPYVRIVRAIDARALAAVYVGFYPLFQRSYEELVNRKAYFNDRLVAAIDDLLAAPEPPGPVRLVRTDGHYEYADADLARRSAGQKILLRMGSANAAAVKAKLRDLRAEVTRGAAPSQG